MQGQFWKNFCGGGVAVPGSRSGRPEAGKTASYRLQGQRRTLDSPGRQDRALNDHRVHGSILPRGEKLMQMDSRHYYRSH